MHSSVFRTLAYADVFDYPLTKAEIHKWLITSSPLHLKLKPAAYYFLPGRHRLVKLRQARHAASLTKLELAHRVGQWLQLIPTIKLVAVTGALAMHNSDPDDDIDLMLVTSPNTLWLTRLLVVPLISLIATRRTPTTNHQNSFCLNLWLDETSLTVPQAQRNLYTAHEVAQVKPIINQDSTYQKFLSANSWVNNFLPNVKIRKSSISGYKSPVSKVLLNQIAFKLQYWYMQSKMTREQVSLHYAFFHPRPTSKIVLSAYRRRLLKLGLTP